MVQRAMHLQSQERICKREEAQENRTPRFEEESAETGLNSRAETTVPYSCSAVILPEGKNDFLIQTRVFLNDFR